MSHLQHDTYVEDLVTQHAEAVFTGNKALKRYVQLALQDAGYPLEEGDDPNDRCEYDHREEYTGYTH